MNLSFDSYFNVAPPTVILQPDLCDFTIIAVNSDYLETTNTKREDLIGFGYLALFPEGESDSSLRNSLTEATLTKRQHVVSSQKYDIPVWGTNRFNTRYRRVISSPIVNISGEVEYIVLVTLDITSAVLEALKERFTYEVAIEKSKAVQHVEEQLRLAIDSAEMGTWFMNLKTGEFKISKRMRAIFGYNKDQKITYEDAVAQIMPEYQEQVIQVIDAALVGTVSFSIEYPILGFHDQKLRWVRVTGKHYEANDGGEPHFSGTVMDITDKKQEEIRKNDFLSIASHELKTPLTSLKASLQLLDRMKHDPTSAMLPKLIDQSNKSMDKINSLVNDLLSISRISHDKIELKKSFFSLNDLFNSCCDHIKIGGTHDLTLAGDVDLKVFADHDRIDQVLVNLVNNAIKYAPQSTSIIIGIEKVNNMAKIWVQDFGAGIPENQLDQLFKRYYQAQTDGLYNAGLGLGLYISAEIVKKHGGEIGVVSELGKGTTFWFTIPLIA